MKQLLCIVFSFLTITVNCQTADIYKLTFSDTSNFRITTYLDHKRPGQLFIIDTSNQWLPKRFWIEGLEKMDLQKLRRNEHHPYNHTYLFRDTNLDKRITADEKRALALQAERSASKKITLKGKNYRSIPSSQNITGFYFVTTEPIFTTDKKYAFIDILVFYKETRNQELNDTYFGTVCIVYEKQPNDQWQKIAVKPYLIL